MSAAIVIAALIPSYLAAGIALLLGLGWVTSLALLIGMGMAITLLLGMCTGRRSTSTDRVVDVGQALPRHS
jgi:hypothetical protein